MAIAVSVTPKRVSPRPIGLPAGLDLYRGHAEVVGDASGGDVDINFNFNQHQLNEEMHYAIIGCTVANQTTAMKANIQLSTTDWADCEGEIAFALREQTTKLNTYNGNCGAELVKAGEPLYLGRAFKLQLAKVLVTFATNTNTKNYSANIYVLRSAAPFMVPTFQGA